MHTASGLGFGSAHAPEPEVGPPGSEVGAGTGEGSGSGEGDGEEVEPPQATARESRTKEHAAAGMRMTEVNTTVRGWDAGATMEHDGA
jgi:hypothetical protein